MWETIIPAATNLISGSMGAGASSSAGSSQAGATDRATQAQKEIFNKQVELQAPFRDAGVAGINKLMYLLGLSNTSSAPPDVESFIREAVGRSYDSGYRSGGANRDETIAGALANYRKGDYGDSNNALKMFGYTPETTPITSEYGSLMRDFSASDFEADPGYAFRKAEGMKGIESGAAARGGLLSGAALKAIQKYGQDLASQEYGNAYSRFTANQTNKYNKLAGLANTGQGAANQLTNAAGNLGQATANNIMSGAAANAAGTVGAANAWSNAIGQGIGTWQQNQLMDLIRNPRTSAVGSGWGTGTGYGSQDYGSYF